MIISPVFTPNSKRNFGDISLQIFKYQSVNCKVYANYLNYLNIDPRSIYKVSQIPFLPIQFFKKNKIISSKKNPEVIFSSSGTTKNGRSKHYITDINTYKISFTKCFELFYGDIRDYTILALLPNYLEQKGSSLIFMVDELIQKSGNSSSGFYLNDLENLACKIDKLNEKKEKVILIGVSYALLDLVSKYNFNLNSTIVMETGGMKGRRKEMIRKELHDILIRGFGVKKIHSEYGMTELLSQAYSKGNGLFRTPPWMKVITRDPEDPLTLLPNLKTGGLNIIDLANINSCSFIATQDLGKTNSNGTFEILGRLEDSDIRGCNLMVI